jgi:hypothetical protein
MNFRNNLVLLFVLYFLGSCSNIEAAYKPKGLKSFYHPETLTLMYKFDSFSDDYFYFIRKKDIKKVGQKKASVTYYNGPGNGRLDDSPSVKLFFDCEKQFVSYQEKPYDWKFLYPHFGSLNEGKITGNVIYEIYSDVCALAGYKPIWKSLQGKVESEFSEFIEYKTNSKEIFKMSTTIKRLNDHEVIASFNKLNEKQLFTARYDCKNYKEIYSDGMTRHITPGTIGESMYMDACILGGIQPK